MPYRYLLVDNDNTLMDFNLAERKALTEALDTCGITPDEETCAAYHHINDSLWKALERGEITQKQLKTERFARLLQRLGRTDLDAMSVSQVYSGFLRTHGDLLPGALELLQAMHGRMKIALVSNGVTIIQRGRLNRSPILPLLDAVIISEEVGVRKPDPRMVEAALEALGCEDKSQAILLGDSLTADIPAAINAGIDSIYLDHHGRGSDLPTYTVATLAQAQALLEEFLHPAH